MLVLDITASITERSDETYLFAIWFRPSVSQSVCRSAVYESHTDCCPMRTARGAAGACGVTLECIGLHVHRCDDESHWLHALYSRRRGDTACPTQYSASCCIGLAAAFC